MTSHRHEALLPEPMVEARNVTLGYAGHPVLVDMTLRIDRGELVGLLGVSGAGKSTLLAALAGGDIVLDGTLQIAGRDPQRTSHPIGLVPQLAEERWGPLCVEEVVALGLPRRGLRTLASERTAVRQRLEMLGLERLGRRRMHELSGGQRQRVSIARALTSSPNLLLCDEPTSGADPVLAAEIVGVLSRVAKSGTTVLIATHDLGVVVPKVDRVIGIANGRVALDVAGEHIDDNALAVVYGAGVVTKR